MRLPAAPKLPSTILALYFIPINDSIIESIKSDYLNKFLIVNKIIHLMVNEFLQSINVDHRIIHEATIKFYLKALGK